MTVSKKYLEFISLVQALNTIVFGDNTAEVTLDGITKPSISKFLAQVDVLTTAELQRLRDAIDVVMNKQSVPTTIVTDGTHSQEWINSDFRAALQALNGQINTKTAQATNVVRGTVTLATNAETLAGTDATKSITPASFLSSLRKLVNVVGMTARTVTAQRAFNTTYYNARDVPMRIHIGFRMPAGANANLEVDGIIQGFATKLAAGGEEFYSLIGFVDPQKSYRFNIVVGVPFIQYCVEYYV